MSWKHLFSKALAAAPGRLHFAAHSHHLWPDASFAGQVEAWNDAARLADRKWDKIMGPVWAEAQGHVAAELALPDPATIAFAPNTHELVVRIVSALTEGRARVLAAEGEFHSFRRQALRWAESGRIALTVVPPERLLVAANEREYDLVFASQIAFNTGRQLVGMATLAKLARPEGPWVVIDGYHGFMATPTDLSGLGERAFYLGGGYKYAMAGEGVCFLHAPPGFAPRPELTGWCAAFDDLAAPPGQVGYAPDARRFLGSTFDPSGLYRFNAVQRMLRREGLTTARISAHCDLLKARFLGNAALAGLAPISGRDARFVALRGPGAAEVQARLAAQDIITDVRDDVLRIGFALYHDAADVDRLSAAIAAPDDQPRPR